MTTETNAAPDVAADTATSEHTQTSEVVNPEVGAEPALDAPQEPEQDSTEKALKRMERRINKRTADYHRERAEKEQLAQELERYRAQQPSQEDGAQPEPADIQRLVREEAQRLSRVEKLNEKANAIHAQGIKKFPDFAEAIQAVNDEAPLFDKKGPTPLMEAVFESDSPAAVLHYLGKNPDIAADLVDLTPAQLTRRLVRIEAEMHEAGKTKTSSAPKPLQPVKAAATSSSPDPAKDPEGWIKWRNQTTNR